MFIPVAPPSEAVSECLQLTPRDLLCHVLEKLRGFDAKVLPQNFVRFTLLPNGCVRAGAIVFRLCIGI